MLYINFVVITDTPVRLRDFLIARGVIAQVTDKFGTRLRGTRPGMEWVRVPNPIVTDPGSGVHEEPGYVPPTYDTRNVYLCKFAHESLANEVDGDTSTDTYDWSKFAKWVKANSTVANAPAGWTINGEPVGSARKITGLNVWIAHIGPERFGVWSGGGGYEYSPPPINTEDGGSLLASDGQTVGENG